MHIPWSEVLTGFGLILNMIGVIALTLTDIFSSKPLRMWWYYTRHVERKNPQETEKEPPVDLIFPVGGGLGSTAMPETPDSYDYKIGMMRNQSIAAIGLISGFFCQFVALFL